MIHLLILLCYHASEDGCDLYFRPEPKSNARGVRVWHMKKVKEQLGMKEVCRNLVFLHAVTVATQHHAPMELARQQPWRNLRMSYTSKSKLTSSAVILLFPTLSVQVKIITDYLYHFSVVIQVRS